jgi:hypothetical protein
MIVVVRKWLIFFWNTLQATEVEEGNRRDRNLEFQRSKENPRLEKRSERKRDEAQKLLEKQVSSPVRGWRVKNGRMANWIYVE